METNDSLKKIWKELLKANNILTTLHPSPDGDSLGSCISMKYVLERLGKRVTIISHDRLEENLQKMPWSKEVEFNKDISEVNTQSYDLLLFLDCGGLDHISSKLLRNYTIPKNIKIINIDHHPTNGLFGDFNYIKTNAVSTCSILLDLFKENNIKIDKELSERLLLGICTDAGFFQFKNNAEKAMKETLSLMDNHADYFEKILKPIIYNQSLKVKKIISYAFLHMKTNNKIKLAYASFSKKELKEFDADPEDTKMVANEMEKIAGIDFVFKLVEKDNVIGGSFRSNKGIDVSLFAKELGGGGHKAAAGFSLPLMNIEKAEQVVLNTISKVGIHRV